jgi:protein SCO1/2
LVTALLAIVGATIVLATGRAPGPPSASVGIVEYQRLPASVLDVRLVDQTGTTTSLAAFRGRIVVLASFLTSCQEECPLTTGAFLAMQRAVQRAGLGRQVVFAELTMDPERDTPERLAAYAHLTGAHWSLLAPTSAGLTAIAHFFGFYYEKTPESSPPAIDWQTGQPYTYDMAHSNGFVLLDPSLHERFLTGGPVDLHGRMQTNLKGLLNGEGRKNLTVPGGEGWTVDQGLAAISWLAGHSIPSD